MLNMNMIQEKERDSGRTLTIACIHSTTPHHTTIESAHYSIGEHRAAHREHSSIALRYLLLASCLIAASMPVVPEAARAPHCNHAPHAPRVKQPTRPSLLNAIASQQAEQSTHRLDPLQHLHVPLRLPASLPCSRALLSSSLLACLNPHHRLRSVSASGSAWLCLYPFIALRLPICAWKPILIGGTVRFAAQDWHSM
jgi:hypothetical protein